MNNDKLLLEDIALGKIKYIAAAYIFIAAGEAFCQTGDKDAPSFSYDSGTGVDLQKLGYTFRSEDISIGDITLTRYYTSERFKSYKYFSDSWSHNFDIWVSQNWVANEQYALVTIGDRSHRFNGTYKQNHPDNHSVGTYLEFVDGAPVYTEKDGTRYEFQRGSSWSKISTMKKPNGETLTFFYNNNNLMEVRSNTGYMVAFEYNSSNNVELACAYNLAKDFVEPYQGCRKSNIKAKYTYSSGRLSGFTAPNGKSASYSYSDKSGLLTCPTKLGSLKCEVLNEYGPVKSSDLNGISKQTFPDGQVWQYDCSCGRNHEADPLDPYVQEWTTIDKGGNKKISYTFVQNGLSETENELGHKEQWEFWSQFPKSHTDPQGKKYTWLYNASRMVSEGYIISPKPDSKLSEIKVLYSISKDCNDKVICNLPTKFVDAKKAETEFTYTSFGSVASVMAPAPTAGAARPLTLYEYVNMNSYIKDSLGNYIRAGDGIWLKGSETKCQTKPGSSQPECDPNAGKIFTSFQYGPQDYSNNLHLRGIVISANNEVRRTCFTYDYAGNRLSETRPRGTSEALCPLDN